MTTFEGFLPLLSYIVSSTLILKKKRHPLTLPPITLKYSFLICLLLLLSSFCQITGCVSGQRCSSIESFWFSSGYKIQKYFYVKGKYASYALTQIIKNYNYELFASHNVGLRHESVTSLNGDSGRNHLFPFKS